MTANFQPSPAPTTSRTIRHDVPQPTSDIRRIVEIRLATADYEASAVLFLSIRRDLEGRG